MSELIPSGAYSFQTQKTIIGLSTAMDSRDDLPLLHSKLCSPWPVHSKKWFYTEESKEVFLL